MIDPKNDLKFTTAGDYIDDLTDDNPASTGTETWQTKATQKGKVPRYYSPVELLSMRVDKLETMIKDTMEAVVNLNTRLSNISSDHLTPLKEDEL